jgi:hypothetical protein
MTVRFAYFPHGGLLGAAVLFSISILTLIWLGREREHTTTGMQTVAIGGWRTKSDGPACLSKGYLDKLLAFALARDELGFRKAMALGVATDQCRWFASGQPVMVDKPSGRFGDPCVRVRGDTDCWYVSRDNLEVTD